MQIDINKLFPVPQNSSIPQGPLPKQLEFLQRTFDKSPQAPKFIAYVGGVGCVAGSTKIETTSGPKAIVDLRPGDEIIGYDGAIKKTLSSVAFPKGRDYLYRVVHEHGEFLAHGSHLVYDGNSKWRPVHELTEKDALFSYGQTLPSLQGTSSALYQLKSLSDAQRLKRTLSSFLSSCLTYYHQYGQLPQPSIAVCQDVVPLLVDVLKFSQTSEHRGVLEQAQLHNHHAPLYDLLSNLDSSLRLVDLGASEASLILAPLFEQVLKGTLTSEQFVTCLGHHLQEIESDHNHTYEQPYSYTPYSSNILSISRESQEQDYWDLESFGLHTYFAEGVLHHNSGKTVSLCINILAQAVIFGGSYVLGRLHSPELRRTTLHTFLEVCPKELILEYRVADSEIRLKSASGKPATIYFVGLDESDKLRSLNLSGAGIDECTQVGEGAFLLLINRLRNPLGLRKIIMVGNPNGHDWVFHRFAKKDVFDSKEAADMHYLIQAPSTENTHLGKDYLDSMKSIYTKEKYETEVMGSFDSFIGQVYDEFSHTKHVIAPFQIPKHWTKVGGIDHGFRNPAAAILGAVDGDGNIFVYKEFYQKEWLIKEIVEGKEGRPGILDTIGKDKMEVVAIDPSTKAMRNEGVNNSHRKLEKFSDYDIYCKYLPEDFPLICANNEVSAGIDRVKSYMKIDPKTNKPRIFIFNTCINLIDELLSYRWAELPDGQKGLRNSRESVVKVNDHSCFVGSTKIETNKGGVIISKVLIGDLVKTSLGYRRVVASGLVGFKPVYEYEFTNGALLVSTEDHPVLTAKGKKAISVLTPFDTCVSLSLWNKKSIYSSMGSLIGSMNDITKRMESTVKTKKATYIGRSTEALLEAYLRVFTSTIKTVTSIITTQVTLKQSPQSNIGWNTLKQLEYAPAPLSGKLGLLTYNPSLRFGTPPQRGWNGIGNTVSRWLRRCLLIKSPKYVLSVLKSFLLSKSSPIEANTVTRTVKPPRYVGVEPVYNLSVEGVSEYFAEGILVSNCDALRYMIMTQPDPTALVADEYANMAYTSLQGRLHRELKALKARESTENHDPEMN